MMNQLRPLLLICTLACYTGVHFHSFVSAAPGATDAPKHKRKAGAPPTAASMISDMQKAVAFIAMSAKDKISTKSKEARPFWSALKSSSTALDAMEGGLKGKNDDVVKGLNELGRSMTELCASWGILRGSHPKLQVGRGVIALSEAYDTYIYHFGPTVARFKKGGEMSKDEKALVKNCMGQLAKLDDEIKALEAKTKANSNQRRLVSDLLSLIEELQEVQATNLKSYCKFMYQWNRLTCAVGGYSEIIEVWYPEFYSDWKVVTADYVVMTHDFEVVSLTYYEGWAYTETSVAKYNDYYERTAVLASVTVEQESQFESYVEEYSEESATEESSEEMAEISEEIEIDEEDDSTLFEEVEDSNDDEDGDGVDDEEDTDDDNDGVSDEEDGDDDGDGVDDADDEDEDEDAGDEDEEDDDADDDGIDDDDDGGEE